MFRRLFALGLLSLGLVTVVASSSAAADRVVDVLELTGPIDAASADWAIARIEAASPEDTELIVLAVDSVGAVTPKVADLAHAVEASDVPVLVWVGPVPAVAYGGAAQLLAFADLRAAAPGAEVGLWEPTVAGEDVPPLASPPDPRFEERVTVEAAGGTFDLVEPAIRQLVAAADGRRVQTPSGERVLDTVEDVEGEPVLLPVRFADPDLVTRTLHAAVDPETTFFLLLAGLTIAAFEYYAVGPGIAAAVAVVCLLLAGYGIGELPVRPWALGAAVGAWIGLTADHQRGRFGPLSVVSGVVAFVAGSRFTDTAPQFPPAWWVMALVVAGVLLFYRVAMPTVGRARFSTGTIGRQGLIGRTGRAVTAVGPDGTVEIGGARWRALAHREAGIVPGDTVIVTGVAGLHVEVEPEAEPSVDDGESAKNDPMD